MNVMERWNGFPLDERVTARSKNMSNVIYITRGT